MLLMEQIVCPTAPWKAELADQKLPKNKQKMRRETWLSNIELRTCTMPYSPFWIATDMFPLHTYTYIPNAEDQKKMSDPLYQDKMYKDFVPLLPDKNPTMNTAAPGNVSPRSGAPKEVGGNMVSHGNQPVQYNAHGQARPPQHPQSQSPQPPQGAPVQETQQAPGHVHRQQRISVERGIYQQPQPQPLVQTADATATTTTTTFATQPRQPQFYLLSQQPPQPTYPPLVPGNEMPQRKLTPPQVPRSPSFGPDDSDEDDDSSSDLESKPKRDHYLPSVNPHIDSPADDNGWVDGNVQFHGYQNPENEAHGEEKEKTQDDQADGLLPGTQLAPEALTVSMLIHDAVNTNKV